MKAIVCSYSPVKVLIFTLCVLGPCGCEKDMPVISTPSHPIQVGTKSGKAVFIDERTGEIFTPRGTNYFHIVNTPFGFRDWFFHPDQFDVNLITTNLQKLKAKGYNTIRVFLDTCNEGPDCIGNTNGEGLNMEYMQNIAELIHLASAQDIFLVLTSNDLPDEGGYWELSNQGASDLIDGYRNSHYITTEGVQSAVLYWGDILRALADLNADFSHVLAWSILNEHWFFNNAPPFSLNGGFVTAANGITYDLSSEADKIRMAEECTDYYVSRVASVIKSHDPDGLVTMGVFSPNTPNEWRPNDFKLAVGSVTENPDLDFLDLHLYPGTSTMDKLMENFQVANPEAKPIIMGEVGAFVHSYPTVDDAQEALQNWIARSCAYSFDGWLTWGLVRAPLALGDATWSLFDENEQLLSELSPLKYPDPCNEEWLGDVNIALNRPVMVSNELDEELGAYAVDGDLTTQWGSGDLPPQWIELDLESAVTISRISMVVAQFPGGNTQHEVRVKSPGGTFTTLAQFSEYTADGDRLEWTGSQGNVRYIRVETSNSPSWVSWKEIEVY